MHCSTASAWAVTSAGAARMGRDSGGMISASGATSASRSASITLAASITSSVSLRRLASRASARLRQWPASSISSFTRAPPWARGAPGQPLATGSSERDLVVEVVEAAGVRCSVVALLAALLGLATLLGRCGALLGLGRALGSTAALGLAGEATALLGLATEATALLGLAAVATALLGSPTAILAALGRTAPLEVTAATGVEHLHVVDHDLGGVAVLAVLALPLAGLQAALDVDLAALLQVLLGDLGQLVEHHHVVPLGALLALTGLLVHPGVGGRQAQVGDRRTGGQEANLGILSQVADEDDLVDATGHLGLL